jgi:hypothetical protein
MWNDNGNDDSSPGKFFLCSFLFFVNNFCVLVPTMYFQNQIVKNTKFSSVSSRLLVLVHLIEFALTDLNLSGQIPMPKPIHKKLYRASSV